MSRIGKLGAAILLTASALILAIGGQLGIAVLLWCVMVFYLLKLDLSQIKQTVDRYEAKVFFCMQPELYLNQLENVRKQLLFNQVYDPILRIQEMMAEQFMVDTPSQELPQEASSEGLLSKRRAITLNSPLGWPWNRMPWIRERLLLMRLWDSLERSDLMACELWFEELGEDWRPEALSYRLKRYRQQVIDQPKLQAKLLDQTINKGDYYPFGNEFIWLFGLVCRGRYLILMGEYAAAEKLLSRLRTDDPYNLLFGEINHLLGDVFLLFYNDAETAQLYYKTAYNFSEGLKLEAIVSPKAERVD